MKAERKDIGLGADNLSWLAERAWPCLATAYGHLPAGGIDRPAALPET